MLQKHVVGFQFNYIRRAQTHYSAVNGTRMSIFTVE
jgi:hypothetical protein